MKMNLKTEAVWWQGPVDSAEALELADELLDGGDLSYELWRLLTGKSTPENFAKEVLNSAGVLREARAEKLKKVVS